MTNTESRIAVELEELAAWDYAEALENDQQPIEHAGAQALSVYGFDSNQQTLVGLGPVERARRSRSFNEAPESQRVPPSEPPGPFIADDDDEEMARSLRRRKLAPMALALPTALIVGLAAVALVRALLPASAPAVSRLAVAAVAPKVASSLNAQVDSWKKSAAEPAPSPDQNVDEASAEATSASERHEERSVAERVVAPHAAVVSAPVATPVAPPVVPVKLPELPPPAVINMSDSASSRVGTLNVMSSPPSSVVLDGRPIGQAPRIVQVPAGTHTVVFIHPLYGRQSRRVIVNPGRTVAASADF